MKTNIYCAGFACVGLLAAGASGAQESGFDYEIELEIGVDSVVSSDDPTAELTDTYASADIALSFALSDSVSVFTGLTFESVLDPVGDRTFGDMGLYVGELGIEWASGPVTLSFGKISPAFGMAWDATPGFYGTSYAEDYELVEMIGVMATVEMGEGTLTASVFYADDTALSRSWGTNRGRNTVAAGGAGNTGKLNNVALQYDVEMGRTTLHAGARFLSRGVSDAADEKGIAVGATHAINDAFSVMGELAAFNGYGGSSDKAAYATLGLSYASGPITYNASYTRRDITSAGVDHLATLGLDYEFANGTTLTTGYGFADEGGIKSHSVGVAFVIPIGG